MWTPGSPHPLDLVLDEDISLISREHAVVPEDGLVVDVVEDALTIRDDGAISGGGDDMACARDFASEPGRVGAAWEASFEPSAPHAC